MSQPRGKIFHRFSTLYFLQTRRLKYPEFKCLVFFSMSEGDFWGGEEGKEIPETATLTYVAVFTHHLEIRKK